jgi:SAM-dependent methyltransferase
MKTDKKKQSYKNVKNCLLCKSNKLTSIFKVNEIALTGVFPKIEEDDPIKTPVNLNICNECSNLQIVEIVEKELMFNNYWYRSGTTKSMVYHFENILNAIKKIKNNGTLLDIGCNDCTFLEIVNKNGYNGYGIEPSVAYDDRKILDNKKIANDFFPTKKNWSLDVSKFDVITAISMFYDVEDPNKFLIECKKRLNENGLLLIEVNYAKTFLERKNVDSVKSGDIIFIENLIEVKDVVNETNTSNKISLYVIENKNG